ncbi:MULTISPECIES: ogr/Delta-like zinc finger family protein [unclassified Halomonas]|uniref:ogr/Delta-like zinc finger family protein n=1 Tax=unclassified Halomonas TaxID=2609666 RepID=UPI0009904842|nr:MULTISPECIES: ogr/Delta-like zinc finger family protein [unclassified Halomonas]AVU12088.1 hypothetical protein BV504_21155 [Halomonas sp. 'Soap Lake \
MTEKTDVKQGSVEGEYLEGEETESVEHQDSRLRFDCPHCGSHMWVRTSKTHLPIFRVLYLHCSNVFGCGFRTTADLSLKHVLAPSFRPNPKVDLPYSPWFKRHARLEQQGQMRLGIEDQTKKEPQHERRTH